MGQQQADDVLAVHVGVGHQDDLVVPELGGVEVLPDPGAEGGDQRADLLVVQRSVQARLLHVQDLAADGQDRLGDRKSTRLNSSHVAISYAVFCLKKKNTGPTSAKY